MLTTNIEDLENYVKNNLGIPMVNFSELDISVANDIVEALDIVLKKYPALKRTICSIGDTDDIINQDNLLANSNIFKKRIVWNEELKQQKTALASISLYSFKPFFIEGVFMPYLEYIGLFYNENIKNRDINVLNKITEIQSMLGCFPKHSVNFKNLIFHEIGHILSYVLNVHYNNKFLAMIKNKCGNSTSIINNISRYAAEDIHETIAEAFSEYMMCPDANDLVSSIGRFIDDLYKRYEDSKIFDVNYKFKKQYLRAEKELSLGYRKL